MSKTIEDNIFFKGINKLADELCDLKKTSAAEIDHDQYTVFIIRCLTDKNVESPKYELLQQIGVDLLLKFSPSTIYIYGTRIAIIFAPLETDSLVNLVGKTITRPPLENTITQLTGYASSKLGQNQGYFDGESYYCKDLDSLYRSIYSLHLICLKQSVIETFYKYVQQNELNRSHLKKILDSPDPIALMIEEMYSKTQETIWQKIPENKLYGIFIKPGKGNSILKIVLNIHGFANDPPSIQRAKYILSNPVYDRS